jgi:glucosamine--fructose-6-phosphate aminotransferase (isomerizing)
MPIAFATGRICRFIRLSGQYGFRHGPNLDVDASHLAIVFALGRVAELGIKLAQECNKRGGKVVLVSDRDREPTERLFPVRVDSVPEPWEGLPPSSFRKR